MKEYELSLFLYLIESGDLDAAIFLRSCEITTVKSEIVIYTPVWAYRRFSYLSVVVVKIEMAIVNLRKIYKYLPINIAWAAAFPVVIHANSHNFNLDRNVKTIDWLIQSSRDHILKGNYELAIISARKSIEFLSVAIADSGKIRNSSHEESFAKIWKQAKRVMTEKLIEELETDSVDEVIAYIDMSVKMAMGKETHGLNFHPINFKTNKIRARYIVNVCQSTAYFIFETFII